MHQRTYRRFSSVFFALLLPLWALSAPAADLRKSLDVVSDTNSSATASQKKIDQLSAQTRALLEEYRRLQDGVEYQAAYTRELQELEQAQRVQIEDLNRQITQAAITRQRIVPLMRTMSDALEKFVVLDLPFHHEERINAVLLLKRRLNQPDLSVSAKFRLLLEAYQLEQAYGSNVEAWRGPVQWQGEQLSVEFLRVGRVALYFQSLDGASSAYWNAEQDEWLPLDPGFNRDVAEALRVARNQIAPQLLQLPMLAPGDAS
jgi:cell division protein FtsB